MVAAPAAHNGDGAMVVIKKLEWREGKDGKFRWFLINLETGGTLSWSCTRYDTYMECWEASREVFPELFDLE